MKKSRSVILTVGTLVSPLFADAAVAAPNFKDQLRLDAQELVADNCSLPDQENFDWQGYKALENEEKILQFIIDQIQSNTDNFCIPPDLKTFGSPQNEEWKPSLE